MLKLSQLYANNKSIVPIISGMPYVSGRMIESIVRADLADNTKGNIELVRDLANDMLRDINDEEVDLAIVETIAEHLQHQSKQKEHKESFSFLKKAKNPSKRKQKNIKVK
jgi:hypothetical protein